MSPVDLTGLDLTDNDEVLLQTEAAQLRLPVVAVEDVAPGTVVVPHGLPEANINGLIPNHISRIEPLSGQHWMTGVPVRVVPLRVKAG